VSRANPVSAGAIVVAIDAPRKRLLLILICTPSNRWVAC
jgi:hypothetical protein